MAIMVPEEDTGLAGRRFDAKRRVKAELRGRLPADHTVFAFPDRAAPGHAGEPAPDFVVIGPRGLLFIAVYGGVVDVVAPGPDARWTHRGEDGYFRGEILPADLGRAAGIVGRRLLPVVPPPYRCQPEELGCGLLHILPDTTPAFTPGVDLASAERRVLISSDLGRLGDWVRRAMDDRPAPAPLAPDLRHALEAGLEAMCRPAAGRWNRKARRRAAAAAALAATVLLALVSERVGSSPHLPAGSERHAQDARAGFSIPAFIPPRAEWAVRGAIEVAMEEPGRDVRWHHDGIGGVVRLLPRDGRPCPAFRISLDRKDAPLAEDRRYCR
jgi:hypothetical protein